MAIHLARIYYAEEYVQLWCGDYWMNCDGDGTYVGDVEDATCKNCLENYALRDVLPPGARYSFLHYSSSHCGELNLIVVRDADCFVVQCLEYDLVAQGESFMGALESWEATFNGQLELDKEEGREPLEGIGLAPKEYFILWRK